MVNVWAVAILPNIPLLCHNLSYTIQVAAAEDCKPNLAKYKSFPTGALENSKAPIEATVGISPLLIGGRGAIVGNPATLHVLKSVPAPFVVPLVLKIGLTGLSAIAEISWSILVIAIYSRPL